MKVKHMAEKLPSSTSTALIDKVVSWLMKQALSDSDLETVVRGACERLLAAGIPLCRVHLSFSVLHPLYRAMGFTWIRGRGLEIEGYRHVRSGSAEPFRNSPYFYMLSNGLEHMRRNLMTGCQMEFPIFQDLRKLGVTDYLAFVTTFDQTSAQGMLGSWSTDQREGFSEEEINALLRIQERLAVACKMAVRQEVARNALTTYLGANAGGRVLNGQIQRGDGETIRSAIVYGDLRGSTEMSEQDGRQVYIETLNTFFDAACGAIADHGGEILNFIGDGFLAIFPCGRNHDDSAQACRKALDAANEGVWRLAKINRARKTKQLKPLGFGLGLHIGNVMFGNVGMADRLAFSVFGVTVNEAARLEKLTVKYATPVVASEAFKDYAGGLWEPLGAETLKGVSKPVRLFKPLENMSEAGKKKQRRLEDTKPRMSDAEQVVLLHRDGLR